MARLCERPGCSERGAIAYGFDADRLLVWLIPLDPSVDRNRAGVLCLRHADAMVVPRGWALDDARDPTPRLFRTPAQARTPKPAPRGAKRVEPPEGVIVAEVVEQLPLAEATAGDEGDQRARTVAEVTGVAAANVEDPDATVAIPWMPNFDESDDLDGLLDARTPLLTRAFRGGTRPR
jgi:hypothetical protein